MRTEFILSMARVEDGNRAFIIQILNDHIFKEEKKKILCLAEHKNFNKPLFCSRTESIIATKAREVPRMRTLQFDAILNRSSAK